MHLAACKWCWPHILIFLWCGYEEGSLLNYILREGLALSATFKCMHNSTLWQEHQRCCRKMHNLQHVYICEGMLWSGSTQDMIFMNYWLEYTHVHVANVISMVSSKLIKVLDLCVQPYPLSSQRENVWNIREKTRAILSCFNVSVDTSSAPISPFWNTYQFCFGGHQSHCSSQMQGATISMKTFPTCTMSQMQTHLYVGN